MPRSFRPRSPKRKREPAEKGDTTAGADRAPTEIPKPTRTGGVRMKSLRWTIPLAAAEFDMTVPTLKRRLVQNSEQPGADTKWSTPQITRAVFGDIHSEGLRKVRAEADILELKRGEMQRRLIPAELVDRTWQSVATTIRQKIWHSGLPEKLRREVLEDLARLKAEDYIAAEVDNEEKGET